GRPSPLPELSIQYADFAAWQQRQTQGESWKQELSFWKKQLHGIPSLMEWPADFVRPARQSQRGARQELRIGRALTDELAELSRREGCTLFMTLLAAFQTLAFRHTGQTDVLIGCPIANRNRSELEELIGCFLNTLVLRTSFAGDLGLRAPGPGLRKIGGGTQSETRSQLQSRVSDHVHLPEHAAAAPRSRRIEPDAF